MNTPLLDFLTVRPELREQDYGRELNRLSDPIWHFQWPKQDYREVTLNFEEVFGEMPPALEVWLKQAINPETGVRLDPFWRRGENGVLLGSVQSLHTMHIVPYGAFINGLKVSGKETFKEMTHGDVISMFKKCFKSEYVGARLYRGIRAYSGMKIIFNTYEEIRKAYLIGILEDGFTIALTRESILKDLAIEEGPKLLEDFDYATWIMGSKLDGMPVPQSMALLMCCITFLRSDKTKTVIALNRMIQRGLISNQLISALNKGELFDKYLKPNKSCNKPSFIKNRRIMEEELSTVFGVASIDEILVDLRAITFFSGYSKEQKKDKDRIGEFSQITSSIVEVALITIAILTGARRNELESIQWSDIYRDDKGDWRFRSDINKTNQGLSTVRYIAGLAAEVVDIVHSLGEYLNPEGIGPLFRKVNAGKFSRSNAASRGCVSPSGHLPRTIDRFLNIYMAEDLKITAFNIHSLRHAWVEFALRRFEGDSVPELIRQHFRHNWRSYMTNSYIHGKLFEEDGRDLRKEYLAELIGRAIDGDIRIYGPVAEFVNTIVDQYEFVGEDELDAIVNRFDGKIEVHSYAICMVRPETVPLAQCYNKQTQRANTNEACFEKCIGCVNRATLPEYREDIQNQAIALSTNIKSAKARGNLRLANEYTKSLKRANIALAEIDIGEQANA